MLLALRGQREQNWSRKRLFDLVFRSSMVTTAKQSPDAGQGRLKRRVRETVQAALFSFLLIAISGGEAAGPDPIPPPVNTPNPSTPDLTRGADPDIEPDAIIVMKEKSFQVVKGGKQQEKLTDPHFTLRAGEDIFILLRNEDKVAHEFVSPLFQKVDLEFSGKASIIYTHTAAGVRIEPGQAVTIRFWLPERFYDLFYFWCDVHGKLYGDKMRGEIFILESTGQDK